MNDALNALQHAELEELNEFFREVLGLPGLNSAEELQNPEVKERFKISDIEQLNWVMRKLGALKVTIDDAEELTKKETKRILDWKNRKVKPAQQSMAFFEELVREWANEQRA